MPENTNDLVSACRQCVDTAMQRYQWELLKRSELFEQVYEQLAAGTAQDARQATVCAYSRALYQACSGADGLERRERGYYELSYYLSLVAMRRYSDHYADTLQRALEQICRTFLDCRKPEAFLAFSLQKLRDAARTERNQVSSSVSLDTLKGGADEPSLQVAAPSSHFDPSEHMLQNEFRERVAQHAHAFLERHPRAAQQLLALWLKHIRNLDDRTIGKYLGKSVKNVHVLRARAIVKLRQDPEWTILAGELGVPYEYMLGAAA